MAHKHMGFHPGGGLGPTFPIDVANGDKHLNIDGQLKRNSSTRHNWVQPALSHSMVLSKNLFIRTVHMENNTLKRKSIR